MKLLKKAVAIAVSSICTLSSVFFSASAETYNYERKNYWYYADDVSFLCSDFGVNETDIDFYGLTPANLFVAGQTSYNVKFNVNGVDTAFNVQIGVLGDANMDGTVSALDAATIAKTLADSSETFSEFNMYLADYDNNGTVSAKDASLISKELAENALKSYNAEQQLQTEYAERILELVNEERKKAGLNALTLNTELSKASETRAKEIAVNFDHVRPNGNSWNTVLDDYNISYIAAGENIAAGYDSPESVVAAWMNSEGHRANILDPDFTEMGIGYYSDSSMYKYYWVQSFICGK